MNKRLLIGYCVLFAILLGVYIWAWRSDERHHRSDAIREMICSLVARKPEELSKGQWATVMGHTQNLHGNSVLHIADLKEIRRFERELKERILGDVDMDTIHWIWDQYADLTTAGESYQHYRAIMLEEMKTVGPNDDPWCVYHSQEP